MGLDKYNPKLKMDQRRQTKTSSRGKSGQSRGLIDLYWQIQTTNSQKLNLKKPKLMKIKLLVFSNSLRMR